MADPIKYWLGTKLGAAVKSHIDNGLKVFPLHGIKDQLQCTCGKKDNTDKTNCKDAGKHPYHTAKGGFHAATDNIEAAAEMFEYRDDLNVGVATGAPSRMIVVDIDNKNNGEDSLKKIQEVFGALPETMTLTTGNGRHLVFDYPGVKMKSGKNVFGESYPGIDMRADGGYIVIYPSRHANGKYYGADNESRSLNDLPKMYFDYVQTDHKKVDERPVDRTSSSGNYSEWEPEDIMEMLDHLNPSMGYDEWIAVGMALHKEGMPLSMWDDWSARGHNYKNTADVNKHWRSFDKNGDRTIGTIVELAMLNGWKPTPRDQRRVVDESKIKAVDPYIEKVRSSVQKKPESIKKPLKIDEELSAEDTVREVSPKLNGNHAKIEPAKDSLIFSFDPMQLPGAIGETVRWITKYAIYEQPELALMNAIAFAGAVFGRKYESPIRTRTNIYMVGIADTGAGKDHSRKMIHELAAYSKLDTMIGGNSVRSDTGMLRGLMTNSSQLLMLDEFGLLMQALSDPKSPHHIRMVSKALMSLYSDSNSVYHHGDYADPKARPIKIMNPNLCAYGTTTLASYVPALRKSAIESGELNRFIVIPSMKAIKARRQPKVKMDEELREWWEQFAPGVNSTIGNLVNSAQIMPAPMEVSWGECDDLQFALLEEQTAICTGSDPLRYLWSRLYENTIKIAMIFAIARDPLAPVMVKTDFDFAYSMVTFSIKYMSSLAKDSMSDSPHESNSIELERIIRSSGEDGIGRWELQRALRKHKRKDLDDMVLTLVESGLITAEKTNARGRPGVTYKFIND